MGKLTNFLYKLARRQRDLEVLVSGDAKKIIRRSKNKWLGRKVASKVFRWPKF